MLASWLPQSLLRVSESMLAGIFALPSSSVSCTTLNLPNLPPQLLHLLTVLRFGACSLSCLLFCLHSPSSSTHACSPPLSRSGFSPGQVQPADHAQLLSSLPALDSSRSPCLFLLMSIIKPCCSHAVRLYVLPDHTTVMPAVIRVSPRGAPFTVWARLLASVGIFKIPQLGAGLHPPQHAEAQEPLELRSSSFN